MPVIQTNLWLCDVCGRIVALAQRITPYADPVAEPPPGWEQLDDERFVCPACLAAALSPVAPSVSHR